MGVAWYIQSHVIYQMHMHRCWAAYIFWLPQKSLIYYIKLKSHPSVRPSIRIFLVERIFAVDARIHVKLARNEAPVFWEHEVYFYNVLTPAVRHLRRFECQGVDDSCRNFTYIPANHSPDTIDNIYYICF